MTCASGVSNLEPRLACPSCEGVKRRGDGIYTAWKHARSSMQDDLASKRAVMLGT